MGWSAEISGHSGAAPVAGAIGAVGASNVQCQLNVSPRA